MRWQSEDFLLSCTQLKDRIKHCLVQVAKGSVELQKTVMPEIDNQLDGEPVIPFLDICEPLRPEWRLLGYFGVSMKADVDFYLRCLTAISEKDCVNLDCADLDRVDYIYQQIEAKYTMNERVIK